MNRQKSNCNWDVFIVLMTMVFLCGCVPEDTLRWSEDGSLGLMRVQGALKLVNGKNGQLTEIEKSNVQPWPDISRDGSLIAYSKKFEVPSLSEGLRMLPSGQVRMIRYYAELMKKKIITSGGLINDKFPSPEKMLLVPNDYKNWVVRYMCEHAGRSLSDILGTETIDKGKNKKITCFQIIIVQRNALNNKRIIATNIFATLSLRLAPNGKHVAYLIHLQEGEVNKTFEEYALCIASLEGDVKAMFIDHAVAAGYDWRDDSKAVAYLKTDARSLCLKDFVIGELRERVVADTNDTLLAKPATTTEQGTIKTHSCISGFKQLAGTIYYPWLKAEYGHSGRIFFSNISVCLPAGRLSEAQWSLFYYDPITKSVSNLLPPSVSDYIGQTVNNFTLSPDGKRLLLPMEKNRFAIYELGESSANVPIEDTEGFGEREILQLAPAWKNNNEISCLVSEKSHFLITENKDKYRKEVVIIGADGNIRQILSGLWSDELINAIVQRKEAINQKVYDTVFN